MTSGHDWSQQSDEMNVRKLISCRSFVVDRDLSVKLFQPDYRTQSKHNKNLPLIGHIFRD